jgi:radical SAM protein with 4Fe4S-binding SPASM domain
MDARFRKIYVEIGNICNLQCSFCPEVDREKFRLSEEQLRRTLNQIKPHTDRACFHLMGEPTAHPLFARFVEVAAEIGVPLEITTNGTLLNPELEAALLSPIVHQVNFSLQSFLDNFPGKNIATYLGKILAFTERALEARPDLYLNYRLWNLQAGETEDSRNEEILRAVEEKFSLSINRRVEPRLTKSKNLKGRLYLHYDTRFEWPHPVNPVVREKGTCQGTRTHVGIHADGTVVPCCLDKEARIPLGNVNRQSFQEVLGGARFQAIHQGFQKGQIAEDLCKRCKYAERFS